MTWHKYTNIGAGRQRRSSSARTQPGYSSFVHFGLTVPVWKAVGNLANPTPNSGPPSSTAPRPSARSTHRRSSLAWRQELGRRRRGWLLCEHRRPPHHEPTAGHELARECTDPVRTDAKHRNDVPRWRQQQRCSRSARRSDKSGSHCCVLWRESEQGQTEPFSF